MTKERLILSPEQNKNLVRVSGVRVARSNGTKLKAYCPYHDDKKNPSLSLNLVKGTFHCWTCKESGTIARLVYDQTGHGARFYLDDIREDSAPGEAFKLSDKMDDIHAFLRIGARFSEPSVEETLEQFATAAPPSFGGALVDWKKSTDAVAWLESRHIVDEVADAWGLKFAFDVNIRSNFKYDESDEPSSFDAHRRLIIPLYGPKGNLLSIEARATLPHETLKSLFVRPVDFLFNYALLDPTKTLYLAEGFIEAARLYPFTQNVTYMFGTAVTDIKTHLLKSFRDIVVVADNDGPGYRMALSLKQKGLPIRIKPVPAAYEDLGDRTMTNSDIAHWIKHQEILEMTENEIEAKALYWDRRKDGKVAENEKASEKEIEDLCAPQSFATRL